MIVLAPPPSNVGLTDFLLQICDRLVAKNVPRGAVLFFEGGRQEQQYDTDRDIEFQQVTHFYSLLTS